MTPELELGADGNIHDFPPKGSDLIDHIQSERCPCRPYWDEKNKAQFLRGESETKIIRHRFLKAERH